MTTREILMDVPMVEELMRESYEKGYAEGYAEAILTILEIRFGPIQSSDTHHRIRTAQIADLKCWVRPACLAPTLNDALDSLSSE
jgi:hypothetical protein